MKAHSYRAAGAAVLAGALMGISGGASAAGFAIAEQSVKGLGTAFAGGAAVADDASTVWYNPAGMGRLSKATAQAGAHLIIPSAKFTDQGSTNFSRVVPLGGDNGGDANSAALVPNLYYTRPLGERWSFGLGVNAPFGLVTEYNGGWVGRYHAVKSDLLTLNINPGLSYKFTDHVWLGAGVSAMYADAELTQAVDYGAIGTFVAGGGTAAALAAAAARTGTDDGFAVVEGDDWGFGFNLGALIEIQEGTRIGAHFRSGVKQVLKGKGSFSSSGSPTARAAQAFLGHGPQGAKANITLPATFSTSIYHEFTPQIAVMADLTWTQWRHLDELRIQFDGGAANSVTTLDWENTLRGALGVEYSPSSRMTLRAGVAYDESPVPNAAARTPRVPDADRTWVALGGTYAMNKNLSFDLAYTHIFVTDPRIAKVTGLPGSEDFFRGNLTGTYDAEVDIISAQVNWQFD